MAEILHAFPIAAARTRVFEAVSTPAGLDRWWTLASRGEAALGADWELDFGPGYLWRARVSRCDAGREFEWEIGASDGDWAGTRVGFELEEQGGATQVRFHHLGWPAANAHFRTSTYCWAMYLRVLRRWLEHGERVPYERRLDA